MTRNTSITIAIIIALVIIGIIVWSLSARNDLGTVQEEYQTTPPASQSLPEENITIDTSIDTDINQLEQELQGL